jgi:hypothetical protein
MPSPWGFASASSRARVVLAAGLVVVVLALPLLVVVDDLRPAAGVQWSASIALMAAFVLTMTGRGRGVRLGLAGLATFFVFANTALAVSFLTQGMPFNDAFFAHLDRTTLQMAWRTDALRLAAMAVYVAVAPVAIYVLTARPVGRGDWIGRVHLVQKLAVLALSLVLSYPLSAFADYRSTKAEASARLEAEIARLRAEPPEATVAVGAPRNLVVIYLESVEDTFFDATLFPGLVPNLTALREEAVWFSDMRQYPGTGWTIAAMVASQCGVPLLSKMWGNDVFTTMDNPFARITCLGEHLKEAGYATAFLGGASLKFAGKGNFLRDNGFDIRLGLEELPNTGAHKWGLYDVDTFAHARELFDGLAGAEAPFALTVLTLDTHFPRRDALAGLPSLCAGGAPDARRGALRRPAGGGLRGACPRLARGRGDGHRHHVRPSLHGGRCRGDARQGRAPPVLLPARPRPPGRNARRAGATHFDVAPTLLEAVGLPGARFPFGQSLLSHAQGLAAERMLTAEDFTPFTIEALTEDVRTH